MDPAEGGPGPPPPATTASAEQPSLPMYSFPTAGQQPIQPSSEHIDLSNPPQSTFDTTDPFPPDPFVASISRTSTLDPSASIPNQPLPQNQPSTLSAQHAPSQKTAQEFFGDLEKAFELSSQARNQPEEGVKVLDDALAMGSNQAQAPKQKSPLPAHTSSPLAPRPSIHTQQQPSTNAAPWPQQPQASNPASLASSQQRQRLDSKSNQFRDLPLPQFQRALLEQQRKQLQASQLRQHQMHMEQMRQEQQLQQYREMHTNALPQSHPKSHTRPLAPMPRQNPAGVQVMRQAAQQNTQPIQFQQHGLRQLLPAQNPGSFPYRAQAYAPNGPLVSPQAGLGVPAQVAQKLSSPTGSQHTAESSATSGGRHRKSSSRKQSQRRPRGKSHQVRTPQESSPTSSLSNPQQIALGIQATGVHPRLLPQQIQGARQGQLPMHVVNEKFLSMQQGMQRPPAHNMGQAAQELTGLQQQLQTKILQQQEQAKRLQGMAQASMAGGTSLSNNGQGNMQISNSLQRSKQRENFSMAHSQTNANQFHLSQGKNLFQLDTRNGGVSRVSSNELNNLSAIDSNAAQKIASATADSKKYAVMNRQMEILRRAQAGRASPHLQGRQQIHSSAVMGPNTSPVTLASHMTQQQPHQVYAQRHGTQGRPQPIMTQPQSFADPTNNGIRALQGNMQYRPQESLSLAKNQALANSNTISPHFRNEIQAQLQAQRVQASLQAQSHLNSQQVAARTTSQGSSSSFLQRKVPPQGLKKSPQVSSQRRPNVPPNGILQGGPGTASTTPQRPGFTERHLDASQATQSRTSAYNVSAQRRTVHAQVSPAAPAGETKQKTDPESLRVIEERRAKENEQLEAARRRHILEHEKRELRHAKRRRLENAPADDINLVLSPDYKTPFKNLADAFIRLKPYHILLPKSGSDTDYKKKWDAEMESLHKKYEDWLKSTTKRVQVLSELEFENASSDSAGYGTECLSTEDVLTLEQVLLEDAVEMIRKEREAAAKRAYELARKQALQRGAQSLLHGVPNAPISGNPAAVQNFSHGVAAIQPHGTQYSANMMGIPQSLQMTMRASHFNAPGIHHTGSNAQFRGSHVSPSMPVQIPGMRGDGKQAIANGSVTAAFHAGVVPRANTTMHSQLPIPPNSMNHSLRTDHVPVRNDKQPSSSVHPSSFPADGRSQPMHLSMSNTSHLPSATRGNNHALAGRVGGSQTTQRRPGEMQVHGGNPKSGVESVSRRVSVNQPQRQTHGFSQMGAVSSVPQDHKLVATGGKSQPSSSSQLNGPIAFKRNDRIDGKLTSRGESMIRAEGMGVKCTTAEGNAVNISARGVWNDDGSAHDRSNAEGNSVAIRSSRPIQHQQHGSNFTTSNVRNLTDGGHGPVKASATESKSQNGKAFVNQGGESCNQGETRNGSGSRDSQHMIRNENLHPPSQVDVSSVTYTPQVSHGNSSGNGLLGTQGSESPWTSSGLATEVGHESGENKLADSISRDQGERRSMGMGSLLNSDGTG